MNSLVKSATAQKPARRDRGKSDNRRGGDDRGAMPLYHQVASTLRRRIEDGHWKKNQQISTLEELEREFNVGRVTVRQAVELLQQEGLVDRKQGKGTFVTALPMEKRWLKLDFRWSALLETIGSNVPRFLPNTEVVPEPVAGPNQSLAAEGYQFLRSVQSRNGQPFGLANVHLADRVFQLDPEGFRTETALCVLARLDGIRIAEARQTFIIGTADLSASESLKIPLASPTAEASISVADEDGVLLYQATIIYRGDCVQVDIDLLRGDG
ncbi:MAG: GntR family transcriptional regulator [Magnetovibrionaceae bacterium]